MTVSALDRTIPPPPGELKPFRFPAVQRLALSNGLPVLFARTEGLPVCTFSLLLPAGAVQEDEEKAGVASLTGSLLESGTPGLSPAGVSERLEKLGVRLQVGTSWEVAHLEFTSLAERVAEASDLVARLVQAPAFPPEEVERLRNHQVAGILQRRAEPRGFANELAARFIFADESPFSRPLHGYSATVVGLTREDVQGFHAATYSPQGAALVVAGNLDPSAVLETAEGAFGAWSGPTVPQQVAPVTPRDHGVRVVIVDRAGAVQSEIRVGHVGVARNTPDFFAIAVMNTILGGAFSSRLNLNLRERHGFTYGARSSFIMRRLPGPFIVSTAVQTEVTGAAIREIVGELHRIRDGLVTTTELEDARQYLAGTFPLPLQTTDGVAARLAELFIHELPDSYLQDFSERVLAVDAEDVQRAARDHVRPDQLAIVVLGDAAAVKPQLDSLDLGPVTIVRQEELP